METQNALTCSINTDLILLYTAGRTSPETSQAVEDHLAGCRACSRAFAREPGLRGRLPRADRPPDPGPETGLGPVEKALLPAWAFVLYLGSRALALLNRPLRRLGVPTGGLMIRLYRLRRRLAGRLIEAEQPAARTA